MKLEVVQYEEHESKPWIRFRFLYSLSGPDIYPYYTRLFVIQHSTIWKSIIPNIVLKGDGGVGLFDVGGEAAFIFGSNLQVCSNLPN